uniref:Uncharacterized protein n=1 Tax=Panagrolaimus davidi TaxID=227884 RepID=A0A914QWM3_9BILA
MARIKVSSVLAIKLIYILFWSPALINYLHQNTEESISKVYCNSSTQGQSDTKATCTNQNFYNLRSSNRNPLQCPLNQRSDNNKEDSNDQSKAVIDAVSKTKDNDDEEKRTSCLNEEGKAVEWFLNMKLPMEFEYMAYDSKDTIQRMHYCEDIRSKSVSTEEYVGSLLW